MKTKKVAAAICIVLVLVMIATLLLSAFGGGLAVTQSEIDALKSQQAEIANQKDTLSSRIESLQGEMDSVLELKAYLDEQNELARQEIEIINEQIALYEKLVEEKAKQLEEAIILENEQKEALRARMRNMEESGSLSYISVLFKATSFTDLLARIDSISMIMNRDKVLQEAYEDARAYVEVVKAEYEAALAEHEVTRLELEEKKAALEREIEAAYMLIAQLEEDIERYKEEFEANEAAEKALDVQINSLVAELERQQQQQIQAGGSVVIGSGTYKWPTPGYTGISSYYGWRTHPIFGDQRFHAGVDVNVPSGVAIVAADSGTVAVAAYSSSYGNYVVISHGNGVSTLYAHMSSIAVSAGASVSQGSTIGYVGSTGWSTGPHLHFEIRVNGSTTDPLSYSYF